MTHFFGIGGAGGDDSLWVFEMPIYLTPPDSTGTWEIVHGPSGYQSGTAAPVNYSMIHQNPIAQNNQLSYDLSLVAGAYTAEFLFTKSSDCGIVTVGMSSDGGESFTDINADPYNASTATIDTYAGAPAWVSRASITGVSITESQVYRIRLLMATKNASSTNYQLDLQAVYWTRTA